MKTSIGFGASHFMTLAMLGFSGLGLLGACSGKTTAVPVARADFPSEYAKALCESIQTCCDSGKRAYDQIACEASEKKSIEQAMPDASISYDANAAGQCLATLRSVVSSCADAPAALKEPCQHIFSGTKKPGESCANQFDCAAPSDGTSICNGDGAPGSQCIVVRSSPQKGDACLGGGIPVSANATFSDCSADDGAFYCDLKTSTCQPRPAIGDACDVDSVCGKGNACTGGKCAAAPAVNETCTYVCAAGLYCDAKSKKCVAQLKGGDTCPAFAVNPCASDGYCDHGTCTAGPIATTNTCAGRGN